MQSRLAILQGTCDSICLRSPPRSGLTRPLLETDLQDAACRICHLAQAELLLSPCWCTGSVQYVCQGCLREWRGRSSTRIVSCELCKVAFQYEFNRVPYPQRAFFVMLHSWRVFALLTGATVCELCWSYGVIVQQPIPMFLVAGILFEFGYELYRSCGEPQFGTVCHSLRRIFTHSDVDDMDLWELHKAEWAQGGITPFEVEAMSSHQSHGGRICLQSVAGYILFVFILIWVSAAPESWSWIESHQMQRLETQVCKPFLTAGLVYLICVSFLHFLGAWCKPPVQLVIDYDLLQPRVRSLYMYEKRTLSGRNACDGA